MTSTKQVESTIEEKIGPNNFAVLGLIGKGSFGEVYLVEKVKSPKLLAMKVLHKSRFMCNDDLKSREKPHKICCH